MTVDRLNLRLPAKLKAWLRERADANHRTMNGEIVAVLERAKLSETKETAR